MDLEELKPEIALLRRAHDEIKSSKSFKRILSTVLSVGNALNGGTFRGSAAGFRIEDLLKLRDTKPNALAKDGPPTLLHYIATLLRTENPDLIDLTVELPHLDGASRGRLLDLFLHSGQN